MSNLLGQVFSVNEPMIKGIFHFDSVEARQDFVEKGFEKIKKGESFNVKGLQRVDVVSDTEAGRHPIQSNDNILNPVVFPPDCVPILLKTDIDTEPFLYILKKEKVGDTVVVHDVEQSVVHVTITYKDGSDKISFSWKFDLQKATNVETVWKEWNATYHLAMLMCGQTSNEIGIKKLDEMHIEEQFWKRALRLENEMATKFELKSVSLADRMSVDLLYLLIVKKVPLRTDVSSFTVKIPFERVDGRIKDDLGKNKQFAMRFDKERKGKLFGAIYAINTHEYIFNALVEAIDKDDKENVYIIKCKGMDVEPAYKVEVMETDDVDNNFDLNERFKKYHTAKTFDEEVRVFYSDITDNEAAQN